MTWDFYYTLHGLQNVSRCRDGMQLGRRGGWDDAYFKGQVRVEYEWLMIVLV